MKQITLNQFLEKLEDSDSPIMKELYYQWVNWLYEAYEAYEYFDNLILIEQNEGQYSVYLFIFNQDNYLDIFKQYKDDPNCISLCISVIGDLSEEIDQYLGFRCYTRKGLKTKNLNANIKLLTVENKLEILEFCSKLGKQGHISCCEANSLETYIKNFDDEIYQDTKLYGYYKDGLLVGYVTTKQHPNTNNSLLESIAVLEEYRRLGIGKELGNFVLTLNPDDIYLYQAAKMNKQSIALAKSLGFNFIGGRELYVKCD